jgi:hypothetical protein
MRGSTPAGSDAAAWTALVVTTVRWNSTFVVALDEGTLVALQPDADRGHERITVSDQALVESFARLYSRLAPLPKEAPAPREFRMVAVLIANDGSSIRVGVPASCQAMTRDGRPVAFDRALFELLASRLSPANRSALDGECALP